jgi:hypothetical protein
MAELSPQAQAIWDAWWNASNKYAVQDLGVVIRAAVNQIRFQDQLGLTAYGGHVQAQNQLLAIAAELEGKGND